MKRRVKNAFFEKCTSSLIFYQTAKGGTVVLESQFKTNLKNEIKKMFPGCIVCHLDPNEFQGIPDLLILYENKWAALEGKKNEGASHRPNQNYYVDLMNDMSFAAFIYPENKEEVLYELQQAFKH